MTEREEFERWAAKRVGLSQDGRVNYAYGATRDAWEVWQARAELGTPHCTKKLNALHANHIALQAECEALRLKAARWIPVSEQMPPVQERVLAFDADHNIVEVDMWFGPDFNFGYSHWMPIPANPDAMGKEKA